MNKWALMATIRVIWIARVFVHKHDSSDVEIEKTADAMLWGREGFRWN